MPGTGEAQRSQPQPRVVLVTGKGGVGKTTVAAALAVAESSRQGATLVEFGDGDAGRRALGKHVARRGLEHLVVSSRDAVTALGTSVFGSALLARAVLTNFAVDRFLRAAPAVREVAMLEAVRRAAEDRPRRRIVVDMPATGHGVAWLRVPEQLSGLLGGGPLYDVTERLRRELLAPGKAAIVIVTLPERLVVRETLDLWRAMREAVHLTPARLIINRFPRALPAGAEAEARALAEGAGREALRSAAALAGRAIAVRAAAHAEAREMAALAQRETSASPLTLAERPVDPDVAETAGALVAGGWA